MKLKEFEKLSAGFDSTPPLPVLFVGHGNPMNAIGENPFVQGWKDSVKDIPKPRAVLCVSAHWETRGSFITAMEKPRTIHDFYEFPQQLFQVQYPAPGSPAVAELTRAAVQSAPIENDFVWGLDHGCWAVLKHMYPHADVPVLQLSLDATKPADYHLKLAEQLLPLRQKGVLIIGSGNMVHNLSLIDWRRPQRGHDWTLEASQGLKKLIMEQRTEVLVKISSVSEAYRLAVPTPEHFTPLMYTLGLKQKNEPLSFFNDQTVLGSISMTSLRIG